jgi:hypothetical protein
VVVLLVGEVFWQVWNVLKRVVSQELVMEAKLIYGRITGYHQVII